MSSPSMEALVTCPDTAECSIRDLSHRAATTFMRERAQYLMEKGIADDDACILAGMEYDWACLADSYIVPDILVRNRQALQAASSPWIY